MYPQKGRRRKRTVDIDRTLREDLLSLLEPTERGDPQSPLRWTTKSVRHLASALKVMGHKTSHRMVNEFLRAEHFSLQANRKTEEGTSNPDRDAQFRHIAQTTSAFMKKGQPIISVDTKKKELVGNYKNGGREWSKKGSPHDVLVHDFAGDLGRVAPYGVYDLADNSGWVSVGITADTAAFAVESIRRWWLNMGRERYPEATCLAITADGGGSNGSRVRLWKTCLQALADETGLSVTVTHFPPGTSKWNKIEHRMFSHITMNWRGRPLVSYETIINLVASTSTTTGLKIKCALDDSVYEKGIRINDEEMAALNITRSDFHGEWNYTISPR
ncbi:hypothetical protein AGMMS50256_16620 [Betaproteobacteria bacterium]|nr:hypothetical protein AGMMS50256_16620 [Betaproteobacteria bacterium]